MTTNETKPTKTTTETEECKASVVKQFKQLRSIYGDTAVNLNTEFKHGRWYISFELNDSFHELAAIDHEIPNSGGVWRIDFRHPSNVDDFSDDAMNC